MCLGVMQLAANKSKIDGLQAGLSTSQATAEDAYQLERLLHQVLHLSARSRFYLGFEPRRAQFC